MVTVILIGSEAEMAPALKALQDNAEPVEGFAVAQRPGTSDTDADWTDVQISDVWHRLSPTCRNVLKEIAKHPTGILWANLCTALEMGGSQVGGSLSSLGGQMNRQEYSIHQKPLLLFTRVGEWGYRLMAVWRDWLSRQDPDSLDRQEG